MSGRSEEISAREGEVLDALAAHLTNQEIAERLFISVRTVESHVSSLLRKLGAADRRELARRGRARSAGLWAEVPRPLSDMATRGLFTGRNDELSTIDATLREVVLSGRRRLLLVVGEAGVGKTRLLAEAAGTLVSSVGVVGFGRCDAEGLVPYQPLVEALDGLAPWVPAPVVADVGPTLGALVPAFGEQRPGRLDDDDVELGRRRFFDAVESAVVALPGPVLLIVDDLHWADRSMLSLLHHLLRAHHRVPVLIAATVRPEGLRPDTGLSELVSALEATDTVVRVGIGGLSAQSVTAIADHDYPDVRDLAAVAWRHTRGNAFLVRELLRHVAGAGRDNLDAIPPDLCEVVARRIAQLDPLLVDVLGAAALVGESFRLGVAARAVGREPAAVLDALDAALVGGVVVEVPEQRDQYRFAHALVRECLVQRLASSRRLHLHLRTAEELERLAPAASLAEVAYHRRAALPEGDPGRAAAVAVAAAAQAMRSYAYDQAVDLYTAAIEALELAGAAEVELARQRLALADAHVRAGQAEIARSTLRSVAEMATRAGDPVLLASAALGMAETAPVWGADPELTALLERARDALDDASLGLRARVTSRLAQSLYFSADHRRRAELSDRAERDARASADPAALAWVLVAEHDALWGPEDLERRVESAGKIVTLGGDVDQPELRLRGYGILVTDLLELGDATGARAAAASHRQIAETLNQPIHLRDAWMWRGTWAMLEGRLDDAQQAITVARELGEAARDPSAEAVYWVQQFGYAVASDDPVELAAVIGPYEELAGEYEHVVTWRAALCLLHARVGDLDRTRKGFEELAVDDFSVMRRDVVWLLGMAFLADVCVRLGDAARAPVLLGLLEPFADRVVVADRAMWCLGSVALLVGPLAALCGRHDDARRWLSDAVARHEAMGAVQLTARSRAALAGLR
ncbi:MAG: ATP-binding protein [Acidimicrobiales bacterium]